MEEKNEAAEGRKGRQVGVQSSCSVCGLNDTRNHKGLTAENAPVHTKAMDQNYGKAIAKLRQTIQSGVMDFVSRDKLKAEVERLENELAIAREEHARYEPTTVPLKLELPPDAEKALQVNLMVIADALGVGYSWGAGGKIDPIQLTTRIRMVLEKRKAEGK